MRAVVYRGVHGLRLETVPVPPIGANELLVKVAVCGVCPTDIKKIQHGTVPPPRIFGHETAGTIVKIGGSVSRLPGGRPLGLGDRVALHHHVPCGDCHFCRHRAFALDLASICLDEKDLIGSYSSDFTLQAEVARLVFSRRLDVRPLITHRFPLEQAAAAIALAANPKPDSLKILVHAGG